MSLAVLMLSSLLGVLGQPVKPAEPVPILWRAPTLDQSFPQAWEYITSRALYNACFCSRRSGKSHAAVDRHTLLHTEIEPGDWTHYGTLIRRNARKHFWNPLKERLGRRSIRFKAYEQEMILKTEFGTWCQAFGCDDLAGTRAVQGDGSRLFSVDECHLPGDHILRELIKVADPMLTARGGMLDLQGLPPEVDGDYFSEAIDGGGFATFTWCMFDHDFPRPREEKLADVLERCKKRGLRIEVKVTPGADGRPIIRMVPEGTDPEVQRQYFGVRVKDPNRLAYEYVAGRNDYDPRTVDFSKSRHAVGVDIGFQDNDAITVGAWDRTDAGHKLRVRFRWQHNHLDVDDLALVVRAVFDVYHPTIATGDHGGHGATKVMETIGNRMNLVFGTKPRDVMVSVGLVNDDFRTGRLLLPIVDTETELVIAAGKRRYADDAPKLMRFLELMSPVDDGSLQGDLGKVLKTVNQNTRKVEINKKGFHSDRTESLRYMHHGAHHFSGKAAAPEKSRDEQLYEREKQLAAFRKDPFNPRNWRRAG